MSTRPKLICQPRSRCANDSPLSCRHHRVLCVCGVRLACLLGVSQVQRVQRCHGCDCLPIALERPRDVMRLVDCDCDTRVTCHKDGSTRSGGWRALARNALTRHTLHENLCKKHSHSFRGADPTDRHKLVDRFRPLEIPTSGLHPLRLPRVSAMA